LGTPLANLRAVRSAGGVAQLQAPGGLPEGGCAQKLEG